MYKLNLNLPTSFGEMRTHEDNITALEEFRRRVHNHPVSIELGGWQQRNTPFVTWVERLAYVDENRVCAQITKVDVDYKTGGMTVEIVPYGPMKEVLTTNLSLVDDDVKELQFSIRSSMKSKNICRNIVTVDFDGRGDDDWLKRMIKEASDNPESKQRRDYFHQWTT